MKHDVITFTETKLDSTVSMGSIMQQGFITNRMDRTCHGGGILTYIRSTLKPKPLLDWQETLARKGIELTLTVISIGNVSKPVLIIGVYRPPQSKAHWFDIFNDLISEALGRGFLLIIMGDLNADLLKPNVYPGKALVDSLKLAGTVVKEKAPTRIGISSTTCLDIIATDELLHCSDYKTEHLAASDHFPVSALIKASWPSNLLPVVKRSFKNVNFPALSNSIKNIEIDDNIANSPDLLLDHWHDAFISIVDEVAPKKNFPMRLHRVPWITNEVRCLTKERDLLARRLSKNKFCAIGQ